MTGLRRRPPGQDRSLLLLTALAAAACASPPARQALSSTPRGRRDRSGRLSGSPGRPGVPRPPCPRLRLEGGHGPRAPEIVRGRGRHPRGRGGRWSSRSTANVDSTGPRSSAACCPTSGSSPRSATAGPTRSACGPRPSSSVRFASPSRSWPLSINVNGGSIAAGHPFAATGSRRRESVGARARAREPGRRPDHFLLVSMAKHLKLSAL